MTGEPMAAAAPRDGDGLPFVSVVIPALNCAGEVEGCIAALRAQGYPGNRFQIVVADNGSTDDTRAELERLNVSYAVRAQRGRSRALNAGIALARGELILTTDMSCRPRKDWIANVVRCFEDPSVGCVAGDIHLLPSGSNLALRYQQRSGYMSPMLALSRRQLPFLPFADGANASFRRAVFDAIGGFDESFFKAADVEICYRLLVLTDYRIVFCPDCVVDETGEPDLRALLKQRFRMGMGSNLMRAKYPGFYRRPRQAGWLRRQYWQAAGRLRGAAHFVGRLAGADGAAREDALVRWLMGLWQGYGERYGRRYLRRQAAQPLPLDPAAVARFVARIDTLGQRVVLCRLSGGAGGSAPAAPAAPAAGGGQPARPFDCRKLA